MQFSSTLLVAALVALCSAQNPFTFTSLTSITAGTPFNITWAPSTGTTDTITLLLRQGDPSALMTIETIASSIQNTGSYLWTPPTSLVKGSAYAFEIIDDGNTYITNYSNQFSIDSTNTVSSAIPASTTSGSSTGSASTESAKTTTTTSGGSSATGSSSGAKTTVTGTSTTAKSTGTSTGTGTAGAATTTSGKSGAGVVKVGAGLLGVVGAVMVLL